MRPSISFQVLTHFSVYSHLLVVVCLSADCLMLNSRSDFLVDGSIMLSRLGAVSVRLERSTIGTVELGVQDVLYGVLGGFHDVRCTVFLIVEFLKCV